MLKADVSAKKTFKDDDVNQMAYMKTERLAQVTYYFKPGQVIDWHRHPEGDQMFIVHEGQGVCFTDEGAEEKTELRPGVIVLAPKGVWHKITARTELIVSAATTQPAGFEKR